MTKLAMAKGFVAAAASALPKGVVLLGSAGDGVYLTLSEFKVPYQDNPRRTGYTMEAGSLLVSTEGGHYYTLDGEGGFRGLGKRLNRHNSLLAATLVQRVSLTITADEYKKPPAKKRIKKKVTKKKIVKKKALRKKRPNRSGRAYI